MTDTQSRDESTTPDGTDESVDPDPDRRADYPVETDEGDWRILCARCGEESTLPFDPGDRPDVYCRSCYDEVRRQEQKRREDNAPRRRHNTRVAFRIECSKCGQEDQLDYVPKGVSMDEILCSDCFEQEKGGESSRWKEIRDKKAREQQLEWSFDCDKCGRTDYLNFPPKDDREYFCTRCFFEHHEAQPERVEDAEDVGRGVYIRKKDG